MGDIINMILKNKDEEINKIKSRYQMEKCEAPGEKQNINILAISVSKKYIYLIVESLKCVELLYMDSKTLNPIQNSFFISPYYHTFKGNFTKIWSDRAGNHNIIRYKEKIYYFNILINKVEELKSFKNIEICAVGFDDRNENPKSTGSFLAADCNNNIYECNIQLEKKRKGDYQISEYFKKLTTLVFEDWDTEEEDEDDCFKQKKGNKDRIYGIQFINTKKKKEEIWKNENSCYIIFATKTKLYQFHRIGKETTFLSCFQKFNKNKMLFNDICKYFPEISTKTSSLFTGSDIDFVFKNQDDVDQFGWKTETGFCFGYFNPYSAVPDLIKNFIVIPFEKIDKSGKKMTDLEPLSVTHTKYHIFILYNDCLTIISKLNSKIIHTEYLKREFTGILFNEFTDDNGSILLYSDYGLYKISLKEENKDIWEDYLDKGDYTSALIYSPDNNKLKRKINRMSADADFESKDFLSSVSKYLYSDENFEIVVLKYLMEEQNESLQLYLELYLSKNANNKENNFLECILIISFICEIILKSPTSDKKEKFTYFRQFIRENKRYFKEKN